MIRHITRRPTFAKGEILRLCPKVNSCAYCSPDYQSIRVEVLDYDGFAINGIITTSQHSVWLVGEKVNWHKKYLVTIS